jgi:hypothetical protein
MPTCVCGKDYFPNQAWIHAQCVTNHVTNNLEKSGVDRVYRWREKNKHKYNAKQREYMRKRRANQPA